MRHPLFLLALTFASTAFAQPTNTDSLWRLWCDTARADNKRFDALVRLFEADERLTTAEAVSRITSAHLRTFEQGVALAVTVEGVTHELHADDLAIVHRASGELVVQEARGFFAAIDPTVTPQLKREGMAREVISRVQRMRKEAGLAVNDRIRLTIAGASDVLEAAREHREWIANEVLAAHLGIGDEVLDTVHMLARQPVDLDGIHAVLALTKDE